MNHLVSICIPAFEQPGPLKKALVSVLSQDYPSFEIIITDDTRNDSVRDHIKGYLSDTRITYIKNIQTKGTPGNWNEGISLAKGDFVKVLHHDDWLTGNDSLGQFVRLLSDRPDCDLAFSATSVCDPQGIEKRVHCPSEKTRREIASNPNVLLWANWIGGPSSVIFRRSAYKPFDVNLKWLVDVEFYITMLALKNKLAFSPKALVATTDGSLKQVTYSSATKEHRIREWLLLYKQWKPDKKFSDLKYFLDLLNGVDPKVIGAILKPEYKNLSPLLRFGTAYHSFSYSLKSLRRQLYKRITATPS